jgi:PKD repeat protein
MVSRFAALGVLTAVAAAAVVFSLTALAAHGQSQALADAPREDGPLAQAEGLWMSIQPSQSVVALGDSFDVVVAIKGAPEISGYDFRMAWNPAVFSVIDVVKTDFMGSAGGQLGSINNEEGTLVFSQFFFPPVPPELPSGDGELAIITLQATGVGTSTLDLTATRVFTRSGGQIRILDPGDGTAESACDVAEIVDLDADSPVELGQTTHFTAAVQGAQPITYTWDFDSDGSAEQTGVGLDTVSHTYIATGTYTATLAVNNVCGVEDVATVNVTVGEVPCQAVQIEALVADPALTAGLPAYFTATVSGSQPITYSWDFEGDGSAEQIGVGLDAVTHTYAVAGPYTVTLTAANGCPSEATETLAVMVEAACEDVVITDLTANSPARIGEAMRFTASLTGTTPYTITWDFGDGGAGTGTGLDTVTPTWTYVETGTYTATLSVENPCGEDEGLEVVAVEPYLVFLPVIARTSP